eukprot:1189354-Prorocentrum_minimum.AAC.4
MPNGGGGKVQSRHAVAFRSEHGVPGFAPGGRGGHITFGFLGGSPTAETQIWTAEGGSVGGALRRN